VAEWRDVHPDRDRLPAEPRPGRVHHRLQRLALTPGSSGQPAQLLDRQPAGPQHAHGMHGRVGQHDVVVGIQDERSQVHDVEHLPRQVEPGDRAGRGGSRRGSRGRRRRPAGAAAGQDEYGERADRRTGEQRDAHRERDLHRPIVRSPAGGPAAAGARRRRVMHPR